MKYATHLSTGLTFSAWVYCGDRNALTDDTPEDRAERIARLERMSDDELLRTGRAAAYMASRSDRETRRVQLEECRAEWRRRHPGNAEPL